jgi:transcriptional regulator with PAS, ATPase and Fis domain
LTLFTIALVMVAAVCLTVSCLHFAVGLKGFRRQLHLLFALLAFVVAADAFLAPWKLHAPSVESFASFNKWSAHLQATFGLVLCWYLWAYAAVKRMVLPALITALWLVHTVVHQLLPAGIQFDSVVRLSRNILPWGEVVMFGEGEPSAWLWVGDAFGLGVVLYSVGFTIYLWRTGKGREATLLSVGLAPLVLLGIPNMMVLEDRGVIALPNFYSFAFLSLVLLMSADLVHDVVRSSELSKEVEQRDRRWRNFLDKAHLLVVSVDRKGGVVYSNPFFRKTFGYEKSELAGRTAIGELWPCRCEHLEAVVPTKSGEQRRVVWFTVQLEGVNGEDEGVLGAGVDITEQRTAEEERDRAFEELNEFKSRLEEENLYLRKELESEEEFGGIIGHSDPIKYVLHMVRQVASTDATVLIEGETGVGKELIARAIHESSARSSQPFIRVNCGALAPTLVESELFGHERGSFTGADRTRRGRFELAHRGTLLLDEVGELPPDIQTKLLRVLQENEFERLGSSETRTVDVRVIASTNRNLADEVEAGRFREDLFYRLHVYPVTVPPLRDRSEDVEALVQHFVRLLCEKHRRSIEEIPASLMRDLTNYHWPGNVRELINVLERAVITSPGSVLQLPQPLQQLDARPNHESGEAEPLTLDEMERKHIERTLESTGWRISGPRGAAGILGLNPSTLRSRLKKLAIERPRPDTSSGTVASG